MNTSRKTVPYEIEPRCRIYAAVLLAVRGWNSVEPEIDFDVDLDGNRDAIFATRLEPPLPNGFYSLLVQAHPQRPVHPNVTRAAVRAYDAPQNDRTLVFGFARLFRELRIGRIDRTRRGNASAHTVRAATDAATRTWANTGASSRANSAAAAGANASSRACSVGRRSYSRRERISKWTRVWHLDFGWNNYGGLNRQLGILVAYHHNRRSQLLR